MRRRRHDIAQSFVGFSIAEVEYAVRIEHIAEVIGPQNIISVPHSPPEVLGVSHHRDVVVPVICVRSLFRLERATLTSKTKWIIVNHQSSRVPMALVVDQIGDVFGANSAGAGAVPEWAQAQADAGLGEVVFREGQIVFVLEVGAATKPGREMVARSLGSGA